MNSNQRAVILLLVLALLVACAGPPPPPKSGRGGSSGSYEATPDGYYRVRKGDSLHAIAFKFGLDWREIARLNGISDPYIIHPDQMLRLGISTQSSAAAGKKTVQEDNSSTVQTRAVPSPSATTTRTLDTPRASTTTVEDASAPGPETRTEPKTMLPPGTPAATRVDSPENTAAVQGTKAPAGTTYSTPAGDPSRWLWPTDGRLLSSFRANDPSRKGIDIGGTQGQPVIASAAGQVVYSGSGLIGYGELIIIKHSDRMLSAYAHNSKRLVNEGQQVTAGSKIAEMGTNDRNQAVLHFEIRVNGSPVNPIQYLPRK